jgi:fimbrial chaperone protein
MARSRITRPIIFAPAAALALCVLLAAAAAVAGQFRVVPIRVFLDSRTKSSVISVVNDGAETMRFQMEPVVWSQDSGGEDLYEPTGELSFFPKIMDLPPGETRVIRLGLRIPATTVEKTYRLFIRELPPPQEAAGSQVAIAVRFGVPIFVEPVQLVEAGQITGAIYNGTDVAFVAANTGNVHFKINRILLSAHDAAGAEVYTTERDGWYLLAGASRTHTLPVPPELCARIARITIDVDTDRKDIVHAMEVLPGACAE